jgi:hypothetical protein
MHLNCYLKLSRESKNNQFNLDWSISKHYSARDAMPIIQVDHLTKEYHLGAMQGLKPSSNRPRFSMRSEDEIRLRHMLDAGKIKVGQSSGRHS